MQRYSRAGFRTDCRARHANPTAGQSDMRGRLHQGRWCRVHSLSRRYGGHRPPRSRDACEGIARRLLFGKEPFDQTLRNGKAYRRCVAVGVSPARRCLLGQVPQSMLIERLKRKLAGSTEAFNLIQIGQKIQSLSSDFDELVPKGEHARRVAGSQEVPHGAVVSPD